MTMAMNRLAAMAGVFAAALALGVAAAHAGPCTTEIAAFETAVRDSAGKPNAGPTLRQSIAAQTDQQPTPESVKRAQEEAQAVFDEAMRRTKRLDAEDDRAGCTEALGAAMRMYNLQ